MIHADAPPVQMLTLGQKKTHPAYVWAYCTTQIIVLAPGQIGRNRGSLLGHRTVSFLFPHGTSMLMGGSELA